MRMTAEREAELEALEAKATPGPWAYCEASDSKCPCGLVWAADEETCITAPEAGGVFRTGPQVAADGALIAAMRSALPALLAEVRALREERDAARAENLRLLERRDDERLAEAEQLAAQYAQERDAEEARAKRAEARADAANEAALALAAKAEAEARMRATFVADVRDVLGMLDSDDDEMEAEVPPSVHRRMALDTIRCALVSLDADLALAATPASGDRPPTR